MGIKSKLIIALIALGIVDVVIPVPILAVILIYVVLTNPPWFRNAVDDIYSEE